MTRNGLSITTRTLCREPVQKAGRVIDLSASFEERLALLERHDAGKVVLGRADELGPLAKHGASGLGHESSPGGPRFARSSHRRFGFFRTACGHRAQRLSRCRVTYAQIAGPTGIAPVSTDEELAPRQAPIAQLRLNRL